MNATNGRGGQSVNVYLDGKQIHAAVKKRDSERGMQLIGDQLGFSY
jgi:head-tail adaptor